MKVQIGRYPDDNTIEDRIVDITIDDYDTWNMDDTLAHIILPMLKQLKETKHGSPYVDIEDVPKKLQLNGTSSNESMQYDLFESKEHDELCWEMLHKRWDWVLDEMIFAFETKVGNLQDWEDQFWTGESDFYWEDIEGTEYSEMKQGPNHTLKLDQNGHTIFHARIKNGFRLFGKYYEGLWD